MNTYHEYRGNIHMHTVHSDGTGQPEDLVAAAKTTGLDFIIVTDHNTLLDQSWEGWRGDVLTLFDIEVHDKDLKPEHNHCLTLAVQEDVTPFAPSPQGLVDAVRERGGLSFFAHPFDKPGPLIPEHFPWTEWDIEGFTGIELWNFMAEFRPFATGKLRSLIFSFVPQYFTTAPHPEMLAKWDELLQRQPVVAIGGSDAHAQVFKLGPIRRRFLSYEYCFRAVNTHILTTEPFNHDVSHDRALVYEALAAGRAWVAYDMAGVTDGFRFVAASGDASATLGDSLSSAGQPVTFHVEMPEPAYIKLIRAGQGVVAEAEGTDLTYATSMPGAYRVEVWKSWWLKPRGWVFSNPVYIV